MNHLPGLLMLSILSVVVTAPVSADTIFDDIGSNSSITSSTAWNVNSGFIATSEFTANANYSVTQIAVALANESGTNGAAINLFASDQSGGIGAELGSWDVANQSSWSSNVPLTVINNISGVKLFAGQSYFLQVAPADSSTNDAWLFSPEGTETPIYNGNTLAYASYTAPAYTVSGDVAPVPLPAGLPLLGSALVFFGALTRRRQLPY